MGKPLDDKQLAWLKALESGAYKRGMGLLKDTAGRYCCLGVAAEIAGCEWETTSVGIRAIFVYECGSGRAFLPVDIAGKFGLSSTNGDQVALGRRNDDAFLQSAGDGYDDVIPLLKEIWTKNGYDVPSSLEK